MLEAEAGAGMAGWRGDSGGGVAGWGAGELLDDLAEVALADVIDVGWRRRRWWQRPVGGAGGDLLDGSSELVDAKVVVVVMVIGVFHCFHFGD